jgi:hypothetical protein
MLKELLMSSKKGEVKKKHFCIGRNFSCLMTSECWLSHIADSSFSCYYPVALSDMLRHDANEDQVLVSPSAVSEARFEKSVVRAGCSGALSIQRLEGSRWRLRRTRPYGI